MGTSYRTTRYFMLPSVAPNADTYSWLPADALSVASPADLGTLTTGVMNVQETVVATDWTAASAAVDGMNAARVRYQAGGVPPLLDTQMSGALSALTQAVAARNALDARMQAVQVARASLDFQLRHRPHTEVDLARFDLWAVQLLIDADSGLARDSGAAGDVMGDVTSLEWVWKRFAHTLAGSAASSIEALLGDRRTAAEAKDLTAAKDAAGQLRTAVAGL